MPNSAKINALIVDDEENGRTILRKLLAEFCPRVRVLGEAANVESGIALIEETQPDLVFLDVKMPFGTGFDLLEQIGEVDFDVIFTTAHDDYAIRAIRYAAIDYLLKPIDIDELVSAVQRTIEKQQSEQPAAGQIQHFLQLLQQQDQPPEKLALPTGDGLIFVKVADIVRCEADGAYTKVILKDGNHLLISKNLKGIESLFQAHPFFRVHHSHLVHLAFVKKYIRGKGGQVEMEDGSTVDVSVRRKDAFLKALQGG